MLHANVNARAAAGKERRKKKIDCSDSKSKEICSPEFGETNGRAVDFWIQRMEEESVSQS